MSFSFILPNNLMDYFVLLCGLVIEYKNWRGKRARKLNKKVIEKFTIPKQVNRVVAQRCIIKAYSEKNCKCLHIFLGEF